MVLGKVIFKHEHLIIQEIITVIHLHGIILVLFVVVEHLVELRVSWLLLQFFTMLGHEGFELFLYLFFRQVMFVIFSTLPIETLFFKPLSVSQRVQSVV